MGQKLLGILLGLYCCALSAQHPLISQDTLAQQAWVNQLYNRMSLDEKIGQLFMVMGHSGLDKASTDALIQKVEQNKLGGVIFSTGGPLRQAQLTNELQSRSKIPLLIAMDAEWGLSMRLDSTYAFPWNMTLGAIQDSTLVEQIGAQIGKHCKRLGVHINFAPVLDVNNNPNNPIIGNRSFGENPIAVTRSASAFAQGLESQGILSCGKHFPGHGDTATDSHHSLPVIPHNRGRLDSVELYPYQQLMRQGLSSVMVAHLDVPELTSREQIPSSISREIINDLLRKSMNFEGLIFTDALNMKAVTTYDKDSNTSLFAFLAGNDMLLMPLSPEEDIAAIKDAYEKGIVTEKRLEASVKRILYAKYKAGLANYEPVAVEGLLEDLNSSANDALYEKAIEGAISLLKDPLKLVGLPVLNNKKIAYVKIGDADHTPFFENLKNYAEVDEIKGKDIASITRQLSAYNLVVVGVHKDNTSPWKSHKLSTKEMFWLEEIARLRTSNTLLASFAKPYALQDILSFSNLDAVLVGFQNSVLAQQSMAEAIFGAIPIKGKLPVEAHMEFPAGTGIQVKANKRLGYSLPENVGIDPVKLAEVDRLVQDGLDSLMYPGAQVLIARKGKIFYHKAFGKPTYDSEAPVKLTDLYDLASLTKILSTLPVIMKMEEEGKIALNTTFEELNPKYSETAIKDVTVLKALSHYGRLPAWIAFYLDTLDDKRRPSPDFYRNRPENGYSIKVADGMFLTDDYRDSIYNRIGRQDLKSNRYRYSDVAYYVFKKYIEETLGKPLDELAYQQFYAGLGATRTLFNPLSTYSKDEIIPTEVDNYFRYQTVQGYVHDMGAAMQGGVGGHAGLFSTANDVAKIMQMYLQGGFYGGRQFLAPRTIEKFNKCYFCHKNVRRGVGFDKPQLKESGPTCGCVSPRSFGHSGFTGTYTWADPDQEIVYVFLSNRTFPSSSNTLLVRSGLRTRIQQAIYDSIIRFNLLKQTSPFDLPYAGLQYSVPRRYIH
jgi:beta-N-acetylhexosaminidase